MATESVNNFPDLFARTACPVKCKAIYPRSPYAVEYSKVE